MPTTKKIKLEREEVEKGPPPCCGELLRTLWLHRWSTMEKKMEEMKATENRLKAMERDLSCGHSTYRRCDTCKIVKCACCKFLWYNNEIVKNCSDCDKGVESELRFMRSIEEKMINKQNNE